MWFRPAVNPSDVDSISAMSLPGRESGIVSPVPGEPGSEINHFNENGQEKFISNVNKNQIINTRTAGLTGFEGNLIKTVVTLKRMIRMKNEHSIKIAKEKRNDMVSDIKDYFSKERDEEIGDLAAGLFLDFILEKLAPAIYNQGVYDSYRYMKDAAEDLMSIQK